MKLKTPLTVTDVSDRGTAFLDEGAKTIASSWGREAHAKLQEVARRANLHDELLEIAARYIDSQDPCVIGGDSDPRTCECVACSLTRDAHAALRKAVTP